MSLSTASLYDQPEYPDITIKFEGGQIRCHKLILCTNSEYFQKLCGHGSQFIEKDQAVIELKGDDPEALRATLRYIYTKKHETWLPDLNWRLQLEIWKTANKYLLPDYATIAFEKFRTQVVKISKPKEVFDAVMHIRRASEGASKPMEVAAFLEKRDKLALLKEPLYREYLNENRDAVWKELDELRDFNASVEQELDELRKFKAPLMQMKLGWCTSSCGGCLGLVKPEEDMPRCNYSSYHSRKSGIVWVSAPDHERMKSNR